MRIHILALNGVFDTGLAAVLDAFGTANALALVKEHLGSLDRVTRVVRLGISLVTTPEFREHPKVADAASELLVSIFGADKTSTRLVFGMASLPVGVCVVLESIFEIGN